MAVAALRSDRARRMDDERPRGGMRGEGKVRTERYTHVRHVTGRHRPATQQQQQAARTHARERAVAHHLSVHRAPSSRSGAQRGRAVVGARWR
eukprot:scaffold171_cov229-Prasinococcus_capsulatus_cf.AAC.3